MERTTEFVARFVSELKFEDIPREVIERAKRQILDVIGVALAGSTQEVGSFPPSQLVGNPSNSPTKCFLSKFDATGSTLLYSVIYRDSAAVVGYPTFCDAMTLSPNGSLMRTPSWKTEIPGGVPSIGEAVKPRKFTSG